MNALEQLIIQAIGLRRELDELRPISPDQEKKIWQKFKFDWNFHSNNIEGNSLTFGETKSLLLHGITAQGKPLKDHFEITGHNQAIDELLDVAREKSPITENLLRNMHQLILGERYQNVAQTADGQATKKWIEPGQYKTQNNHVLTQTGEIFRFAEPFEVQARMQVVVELSNRSTFTDLTAVLVTAANLHYEFVRIHPFDDGNGRMARLFMNLFLIKHGFPPAIIKTQDKTEYFRALQQADGGQVEVFDAFVVKNVVDSLLIMVAGARGQNIEAADEQDKKIKMLQRLLKNEVGQLSAVKTDDSIREIIEFVFEPLKQGLLLEAEKFSQFYLGCRKFIWIDGKQVYGSGAQSFMTLNRLEFPTVLAALKLHFNENTGQASISLNFDNLSFQGHDRASFSQQLTFHFHKGSYELTLPNDFVTINRPYSNRLTPAEIAAICKKTSAAHIEWIESTTGVKLPN
jgi:Fic family protein